MTEKLCQRMNFVNELTLIFGGTFKMSMVVCEERSDSVLQKLTTYLISMRCFSGYMVVLISTRWIHKAGLEELLKRWNLKPNKLWPFGDSENGYWKNVRAGGGISYAMEMQKTLLKKYTKIAPANSQAGVYQVLENWLEKGE